MSEGLADWLRLSLAAGVGLATQRTLLAAFGLPEQVFSAGRSALVGVVGAEMADRVLAAPDQAAIDTSLEWSQQSGNHLLTLADADYPPGLLEIPDPPILLWVKGDLSVLQMQALAIVGARSATPQGIGNAEAFARSLATAGWAIVSGLALGVDAAAHRGALAAGQKTLAVIGTGADRVYPASHRELAHEIAGQGVLLSEFPLGAPPLPSHFPRRNRLIAGLSRGVLVVEAAVGSGSLITARLASECGREVFAIPGSIHSPLARGCHRLIREGAKLVETAQDIVEELQGAHALPVPRVRQPRGRLKAPSGSRSTPVSAGEHPDPQARAVLAAIGHDPVDIDTIATRSGLTVDALYAILLPLELEGWVSHLPGGRFQCL